MVSEIAQASIGAANRIRPPVASADSATMAKPPNTSALTRPALVIPCVSRPQSRYVRHHSTYSVTRRANAA